MTSVVIGIVLVVGMPIVEEVAEILIIVGVAVSSKSRNRVGLEV